MAKHNKTPILQIPRQQGGTLYVFPSAMEDVGLNLNTRANSVAMSHFALLNIPQSNPHNLERSSAPSNLTGVYTRNQFNITLNQDFAANAADESGMVGSEALARSLQNYAMNLETVLVNSDSYNYQDYNTVSERVFWKWLKECGAIRFKKLHDKVAGKQYFLEGDYFASNYDDVVRCFGAIDSGNSLSTDFGMFNETYINIPSSYGAGRTFFKTRTDENYPNNSTIPYNITHLEGRETDNDEIVYTENKPYTDRITASIYDINNSGNLTTAKTSPDIYQYVIGSTDPTNLTSVVYQTVRTTKYAYLRSNLDCIELVKDIPTIKQIMSSLNIPNTDKIQSYDEINTAHVTSPAFEFNTVLLYYSVYDSNNFKATPLATNLFGVMFLDNPKSETTGTGHDIQFGIPTLTKQMSNGTGFGTGYSFRVNIKTQSVYDNTDAIINDNTTTNALTADVYGDIVGTINKAVDAMNVNVQTTRAIQDSYVKIMAEQNHANDRLDNLERRINTYIGSDNDKHIAVGKLSTRTIQSVGDLLSINAYDEPTNTYVNIASLSKNDISIKPQVNTDCVTSNRSYVNVTKYYNDESLNIRNGSTAITDMNTILNSMFGSSGINIKCATVNEAVQTVTDDGIVTSNTFRNNELYIDPDSPIFNNTNTGGAYNLDYMLINTSEGINPYLNSSMYKTSGVDYVKLIPYIIAELQILNQKIAR